MRTKTIERAFLPKPESPFDSDIGFRNQAQVAFMSVG